MKAIVTFIVILSSVTIAAQAGSPYNVNFATEKFGWGRVGEGSAPYLPDEGLTPLPGVGLVSKGPWLLDVNHVESALLVGPAVIWTKGQQSHGKPGIPGTPNLVGTTIRVRIFFDYQNDNEYDARLGGRLLFWFQSEIPKALSAIGYAKAKHMPESSAPQRIVNYVFNLNLLPKALDSSAPSFELPLTDDLNQWTCLGRDQLDYRYPEGSAVKYTCALNRKEFKAALSAVNLDMGLLLLLPDRNQNHEPLGWLNDQFPERTPGLGKSKLVLKEFVIVKK